MKKHYDQIKNVLDDIKYGQDIAIDTFFEKLKLTEDQYLKAIRYSLKHPTLFLKRSPFEIRINNYNLHLLKAWRANMDLQFVLDPYACVALTHLLLKILEIEGMNVDLRSLDLSSLYLYLR